EAYVTPVGEEEVGVAVLTTRRAPYDEQLAAFPELVDRIAGATASSTVRGAGPLRQESRRRVVGRVLLVGDASGYDGRLRRESGRRVVGRVLLVGDAPGYVDALTGEGISLALAQAQAAVHHLVGGDPAGYERTWRRIVRRHRLLTGALLAVGASP